MEKYIEALIQAREHSTRAGEEIHEEACALPVNERGDHIREWDIVRGEIRGLDLAINLLEEHLRVCIQKLEGPVFGQRGSNMELGSYIDELEQAIETAHKHAEGWYNTALGLPVGPDWEFCARRWNHAQGKRLGLKIALELLDKHIEKGE